MNMLSKICTVLMLTGAVSLMAADGDNTGTNTTPSGGKGGPRTERGERGPHGPRGGHGGPGGGNFSFMVCPNCHHRLIVLAPGGRGGHGGREGREGGERGPRGGRRGPGPGRKGAPQQKPQTDTQEK